MLCLIRKGWQLAFVFGFLSILTMMPAACSSKKSEAKTKFKVAYLGLTCEAPIFIAKDYNMFAEEGLDVELVKTDWDGLREGLGTGQFDANHTLIMYLLKPIESGMDLKITGGIHTGCLRVQVAKNSDIKTVKDLKGKKIGVPTHLGSPPYLFASRVLVSQGLDPRPEGGDVQWLPFPPDVLGKALQDGRIDALATSDPIGTILLGEGIVRTIVDQAIDAPYKDEYCCAVVVNGRLCRDNPESAARLTRALLKAAMWVEQNPTAAARHSVEHKYIASSAEMNAQAISKLRYIPGVDSCRLSVLNAAREMKMAGLLKPTTSAEAIADKAWMSLEGVNDEWIKNLIVPKVANGGKPPLLDGPALAALFQKKACCGCCCVSE